MPHAKQDTLTRLVLHCKEGAAPPVQEYYDKVVQASFEPEWKGGKVEEGRALAAALQLSGQPTSSGPKAACFIIDRTWPPILQVRTHTPAGPSTGVACPIHAHVHVLLTAQLGPGAS